MKFLGQYNSKATVEELLHFFRNGGMKAMLAALQSDVDAGRVIKRLRLEANQENNGLSDMRLRRPGDGANQRPVAVDRGGAKGGWC